MGYKVTEQARRAITANTFVRAFWLANIASLVVRCAVTRFAVSAALA